MSEAKVKPIEVVAKSIDAAYSEGFRDGCLAMREAAAKWAGKDYDHEYCLNLAQAIRVLPLPTSNPPQQEPPE